MSIRDSTAPRRWVSRKPLPDVRVGQVWADNDIRAQGRTFRVQSVEGDVVVIEVLTLTDGVDPATRPGTKKVGRIRRERFVDNTRGYRLIEET